MTDLEIFLNECRTKSTCTRFGCMGANSEYCKNTCNDREITLDLLQSICYNYDIKKREAKK